MQAETKYKLKHVLGVLLGVAAQLAVFGALFVFAFGVDPGKLSLV
jgi:hypothetical protein